MQVKMSMKEIRDMGLLDKLCEITGMNKYDLVFDVEVPDDEDCFTLDAELMKKLGLQVVKVC